MIDPKLVKQLRDKTGAGFTDCKKALEEAGGDFAQAQKLLKEWGIASSLKRNSREAREGKVFLTVTEDRALGLDLACETDFVAKTQEFFDLGQQLLELFKDNSDTQVTDPMKELIALAGIKLKENIFIRTVKKLHKNDSQVFATYSHNQGEIGVIIQLESMPMVDAQALKTVAFDLALHVSAFAPLVLSRQQLDPSFVQEQKDLARTQLAGVNKPEEVLQRIIEGKVNKALSEVVLLEQPFVKDDALTVAQFLDQAGKSVGSDLIFVDYVYLSVK